MIVERGDTIPAPDKFDEHLKKERVAAGATIAFGVASLAFPPAVAGAIITIAETARQTLLAGKELIKQIGTTEENN